MEQIGLTIANLALETLRDALVEGTKVLLSVSHGDVERVKNYLEIIHAMLMKADREQKSESQTVKAYVKQLERLAYAAEDLVERYAVEVESKNEAGRSLKAKLQRYACILCECCTSHQLEKEAGDMVSSLADLTTKLESEFGRQSSPNSNPSQEQEEDMLRRQTYPHEEEPHLVGMEEDIKALLSKVKDDESRSLRVIKIYGMGGLGKTTLARKVYNHDDVESYAKAWVCVTQRFDAWSVLGKILEQLDDNKLDDNKLDDNKQRHKAHPDSNSSMDDLVKGIRRLLEQRKCLIVIDDLWKDDHWDIIKKALPTSCNVLLTTRFENIANRDSEAYKLRFLTKDQGWELLQKIALPHRHQLPPVERSSESLKNIGRQMVIKCGHLPLSISVIGGILRQRGENLAEWEKISTKMDSYLNKGEGVGENKRVKEVLELSYEALPYYLKPCFLYLACFAEDEEIETQRLYLLWMAEGFISYHDKGPNETLRDVAERYLNELAMRCMVEVRKSASFRRREKFDGCRLHDLMHDLCSAKAQAKNLVKSLKVSGNPSTGDTFESRLAIPSSLSSTGDPMRRLAINVDVHNSRKLSIRGLKEVKNISSLMLFINDRHSNQRMTFKDSGIDLERSRCLWILVLDCCEFERGKLPGNVRKLKRLRYLSLKNCNLVELPKFVCGMPYLQTLDLRSSSGVIRLHNVIWKMKRLKHLFMYSIEVIGGEKLRLEGLDELETLEEMESQTVNIADFLKLMSLRKVLAKVHDIESMLAVARHCHKNNDRIRSCETNLSVDSCHLTSEEHRGVVEELLMSPSLLNLRFWGCTISCGFPLYKQGMCQSLRRLIFYRCNVWGGDVNAMKEIGNYPMLQTLHFHGVDMESLICPPNSFPQLKSLELIGLQNLKKWEMENGAMPKLTHLWIAACSSLDKFPDGLRFVSTLQQLVIADMPEEFNERVKGEDHQTVAHVPYIDFRDHVGHRHAY